VEEQIYPNVTTGFTDSNAYLRELTLKSMLTVAPKLSQKTLSNSLLKFLAKLQVSCTHLLLPLPLLLPLLLLAMFVLQHCSCCVPAAAAAAAFAVMLMPYKESRYSCAVYMPMPSSSTTLWQSHLLPCML